MGQKYYTAEQLELYMSEHNISKEEARKELRKLGFKRKSAKRNILSPYYTEEEAIALAKERSITLQSAKSYIKRNFKGNKRLVPAGSVYYTETQLQTYMQETGKSRNASIAILRYRSLHPNSVPKPIIKPVITNEEDHTFTEEQILVYMYQSNCTKEVAIYNMCREQIVPSEYPIENWMLLNNKWTLITHNCL